MRHLALALIAACRPDSTPITQPAPPRLECSSNLRVPTTCPIWAPGDSDDNDEGPLPDQIAAACDLDDSGATWGTAGGDQGPGLAIIPGGRELGVYLSFDPSKYPVDVAALPTALSAYAAPDNVDKFGGECCPELDEANRIPIHIVAIGATGVLISLGMFDTAKTQVEVGLTNAAFPGAKLWTEWNNRFYVNGAP